MNGTYAVHVHTYGDVSDSAGLGTMRHTIYITAYTHTQHSN